VVSGDLATLVTEQSRTLDALRQVLLRNAALRAAMKTHDRERLLADYGPVFAKLRADHDLTHFYFSGPDRVCLLRIHNPEKHGDRIDRFTMREAERTGKTAAGLELGPLDTFTLRSVQPVYDGGALIGYLELGKEIEDILAALCPRRTASRLRWRSTRTPWTGPPGGFRSEHSLACPRQRIVWFTVRLAKQPKGTQPEAHLPADLRNVRVLIVDDNVTSREILTTRMASWGMRPAETPDGPAALQALLRALDEGDPFRIAVIDMQMPGMDGKTLGLAVKADKRLAAAGARMAELEAQFEQLRKAMNKEK
jgi:CheY-like chemotaxis protein